MSAFLHEEAYLVPADSLALVRAMLKDQTSAGSRVSNDFPKFRYVNAVAYLDSSPSTPAFPYITFERTGGGRSENDKRRVEPRIQVNAWAQSRGAAYALAGEIEAVFLPSLEQVLPAGRSIAQGFNGEVMVGATPVYVWDVVQEVGPTWLPDPDTGLPRYFQYLVLKHF